MKSNDIGGLNPYLTFALSAFVEMFGGLIALILVDRIGRKIPYALSLILSGAFYLSIGFIGRFFF
jgi:hypothetical protein